MAAEILMPKLGLTMKTGTVAAWFKDEGDAVAPGEPVLEIETEKLSHQIESPSGGILLKKLAAVGEKYPVASVLGYIGSAGEQLPATSAASTPVSGDSTPVSPAAVPAPIRPAGRVFISPVARKLAAELGLDYTQIPGTGPNGRIVKADVERFSDNRRAAPAPAASAEPDEPDTVIPYSGMRRAIGEKMSEAWKTIPMVTHHVMADAGALMEFRELLNRGVTEKADRVSVNDLILKLTAAALALTPVVNSSLTPEGIVLHRRVHIGMATTLDSGLIVPVIRDADCKSLLAVSREAKDLAVRARSGSLGPDEIQGGTFTVTNLGGYGSVDLFTPIINPPEAAILGVGRVKDTATPVGGDIVVRPLMGLSFTYDHRIIDGAVAADFIKTLMRLMENPARAVLC